MPASRSSTVTLCDDGARTRPKFALASFDRSGVASAAVTSIRPEPTTSGIATTVRAGLAYAGLAVSSSAERTSAGVQRGWRWSSSAAAPATAGEAMLVPSQIA